MSLWETVKEALRLRDQMRADGASDTELAKGLEQSVRAAWPQGREWQYKCDDCRDTGLIEMVCKAGQRCEGTSSRVDHWKDEPGKYRRLCALNPTSDYEHTYTMPCFCAAGSRFKRQAPTPETDDDRAAKVQKPFTKWGK